MSLVNLKHALNHAEKYNYGIGAFNVSNMSIMSGILSAAEEKKSPVILSFAEGHFPYMDFELMMVAAVKAAYRSTIPVVLHLDHGQKFENIMKAIRYGVSSVMVDASMKPFMENIALVSEAVRMCAPLGISVEGELGCVGGGEGDGSENIADKLAFTDIDQAVEYITLTGIDALAIAFGNVHGRYKGEPKLDFDRLDKISKKTQKPIVLHGGSGISDADFQKAISLGIRKINFYTGSSLATHETLLEYLKTDPYKKGEDFARIWKLAQDTFCEKTKHNMEVFGSVGMADRY